MIRKDPKERAADLEARKKYKGRYFYKLVFSMNYGRLHFIRVDKVERTKKFKEIREELELKVAEKFTGRKESYYESFFDPGLQLMDYAYICDKYLFYYDYKQAILKEDYGIDYLHFLQLNPNR